MASLSLTRTVIRYTKGRALFLRLSSLDLPPACRLSLMKQQSGRYLWPISPSSISSLKSLSRSSSTLSLRRPSEGWPTVGGEPSDFSPVTSLYAPGGKYSAPSDSAYTPSILPQDLSTEAPTPQQFGVPPATEPAVNPNTGQPAPQQETADTIPADKVDPKDVVIDPNTGELTDSKTGKIIEPNVDPQTGKDILSFRAATSCPRACQRRAYLPNRQGPD